MKHTDARLLSMLNRMGPLPVIYTEAGQSVSVMGGLYRNKTESHRPGNIEADAGTVIRDEALVLLRLVDLSGKPPPEENTVLTVGGISYRSAGYQLASDGSSYIVTIRNAAA